MFYSLSIALGSTISLYLLVSLFGLSPKNTKLSNLQKGVLTFSTIIVGRMVLLNWKSEHPPAHTNWVHDMMSYIHLEKIRYLRDDEQQKFCLVWERFISHFSSLSAAEIMPTQPPNV